MDYAPIALFVYKRLWHTQQTVASLQKNPLAIESDLIIFSDGPNKGVEKEVQAVRQWLSHIDGFKSVQLILHEKNKGLAQSIIHGVTELTNRFGKVIVVEDDMVVSPYFLNYMNQGLTLFAKDEKVASICGYAFPIKAMPSTYFLQGADCWGWATWKRAWARFEPDGKLLLNQLRQKKLCHQFDYHGTQPYVQMLKDQIKGKNNSWAIRWYASTFLNNMLSLYPGNSLVQNIGMDYSGEHSVPTAALLSPITMQPISIEPITVENNEKVYHTIVNYFKSIEEPLYKKIIRKVKKYVTTLLTYVPRFMRGIQKRMHEIPRIKPGK